MWSQVTQGSTLYAVPEDIGPMGLMYQPSVLKKYHLPVPATWATFASDAVALHKADPNIAMTYFPVNDGDYLEALFWQAGARPYQLLPNGTWKIDVDGPIEQKVLNYWGKLVDEKAVAVDNDFTADWGHHIANDHYASYVGAAWGPTYKVDTYLTRSHPQIDGRRSCRSGPRARTPTPTGAARPTRSPRTRRATWSRTRRCSRPTSTPRRAA